MNFLKSVAVLGMFAMVVGCSKNDPAPSDNGTPEPTPLPEEAVELKEQLLGRWELNGEFSLDAVLAKQQAVDAARSVARTITKRMETSPQYNYSYTYTAFIEFLSNDRYLLSDTKGKLYSGSFEVDDDGSVALSGLGRISDIEVGDGDISFDFTPTESNQTIKATGSKVAEIEADDRTTKLVGTWELLPEEDGAAFYAEPFEVWGENDTIASDTVMVERLTLTFTGSGTYALTVYAEGGTVVDSYVQNWRWHSSDADKFVYWEEGWDVDEDEDYVQIVRNDNGLLHTEEYWIDGDEIEVLRLNFKRVAQ